MKRVAVTGAGGFLGLHLRAAAKEKDIEVMPIALGEKFNTNEAMVAVSGADKLIHLAGINRGTDDDVANGNVLFVKQLESVLANVERRPGSIIYANSVHAGNGTVYGTAKEEAGEYLQHVAEHCGIEFENILLPNIFGEYGRPFYNSVVATFSHLVATGTEPEIQQDKELQLLHAQNAVDILLGYAAPEALKKLSVYETVSGVKRLLEEFAKVYELGEFPDLSTNFRRDLFNTYRSYTFPEKTPLLITRHADHRGSFFEIVRSRGGTGQTSFSTTAPGITRGDHYHRRKIERFTVLAGEAEISLRRLFDDEVYTYRISGDEPKSVDMPTLYSHNIRNVGKETLFTAFWTNDIFDPIEPDTIAEIV